MPTKTPDRASSNWYWACADDGPARGRFVIAHGQDELWSRVRRETCRGERAAWNGMCPDGRTVDVAGILDLLLTVVLPYQVDHNRFMVEAAQIPSFAVFLREARADLCNYVSNPSHLGVAIAPAPYSAEAKEALRRRIDHTLSVGETA